MFTWLRVFISAPSMAELSHWNNHKKNTNVLDNQFLAGSQFKDSHKADARSSSTETVNH
jgi:hypothetical protein